MRSLPALYLLALLLSPVALAEDPPTEPPAPLADDDSGDDDSAATAAEAVTVVDVVEDPTDADVEEAVRVLVSGSSAGWASLAVAALTLAWAFVRRLGVLATIPDPWPTVVVSILGMVGAGVAAAASGVPWWAALLHGVVGCGAALGLWASLLARVGAQQKPA